MPLWDPRKKITQEPTSGFSGQQSKGGDSTTGQGANEMQPYDIQFDGSSTEPDSFTPTEYNQPNLLQPKLGSSSGIDARASGIFGGGGGDTTGQGVDEIEPYDIQFEDDDFMDRGITAYSPDRFETSRLFGGDLTGEDTNLVRNEDPFLVGVGTGLARTGTDDWEDNYHDYESIRDQLSQAEKEGWRGQEAGIDEYLQSIFGEEASFDPIRQQLEAARDEEMRRFSEGMASRGMADSGAAAGGLADIGQAYWRDLASEQQGFNQQQIENKQAAASMLFQDSWNNLDREHQETMTKLMFELERKRDMGDDYDPNVGAYEMQLIRDMFSKDDLDAEDKHFLEGMLRSIFGDEFVDEWFGSAEKTNRYQGETKTLTGPEGLSLDVPSYTDPDNLNNLLRKMFP